MKSKFFQIFHIYEDPYKSWTISYTFLGLLHQLPFFSTKSVGSCKIPDLIPRHFTQGTPDSPQDQYFFLQLKF